MSLASIGREHKERRKLSTANRARINIISQTAVGCETGTAPQSIRTPHGTTTLALSETEPAQIGSLLIVLVYASQQYQQYNEHRHY